MRIRQRELKGLGIWLLAASQLTLTTGCRQLGGRNGPGSSSTAPGSTAGPNIGLIVYNAIHTNLQQSGAPAQVTALENDKQVFIDAVNHILPTDVSTNLFPTLMKLLPLVDDDTIPNGLKDVDGMLKDMIAAPDVVAAMASLQQGSAGIAMPFDPKDAIRLVGKMLSHPQFDQLATATNHLINTQPDVLRNLQSLIARKLQAITPQTLSQSPINLQGLATTLLSQVDTGGLGDLGDPAWAVHLDKNGNPQVAIDPATKQVLPPFVDDGSGNALTDANGNPVDATGAPITIKPFGSDGSRDSSGRALSNGQLLFVYFDAKQTLLAEILILVGQLIRNQVPQDLESVIDKIAIRVQHPDPNDPWTGFSNDCPLVDLMTSGLEVVRRTPAAQLLQGLSIMVQQDPVGFEATVTDLVLAINLAKQSGFTSAGNQQLVNDLLPLITNAAKQQGTSISAVRALLRSFNSAQAQLQNLPKGFALMMQYNDYGKKIPTGPGLPSEMERLLDIMNRSSQCNAPFLGNLANLYLDTMAGNGPSILGFKPTISTMNALMGIGPLRSLLCSQLNADDVGVLQDFVDTGSLDAFTPIVKAFSDQKETSLLVQIMLTLQKDYATAMRPNEPAVIKLLNSGAVEKLFSAINRMTTIMVPPSNEALIDILADTVTALVDDSTPIVDRKGRSFKTLVNYLLQPLQDLQAECQNAGCQDVLNRALSNLTGQLLATYTDQQGNQKLVYSGLVSTLGSTLNFVAQQIPADPATRSTWVDSQEQTISNLFTGRDFAALASFVLAVNGSPDAQTFKDALAGLFTPTKDPAYDACGAMLQLVAALIQHKPGAATPQQTAADMAKVMNFMGAEMDPASGKTANLLTMIEKIVAADDGLLILKVTRNAIDMGPNGNQDPPILTLVHVYNDVHAAAPASTTGQSPADALMASLNKIVAFMEDQTSGLPHFVQLIKNRSK